MAKALISLRIPQADLAVIDKLAGTNGLTRSSLIEAIIGKFAREDFFNQRAMVRDVLGPSRKEAADD